MNSTHIFLLALSCILSGAAVHVFAPAGPIALLLVTAGATALGGASMMARNEARKESAEVRQKAQEAMEQTQTLRRDMLPK